MMGALSEEIRQNFREANCGEFGSASSHVDSRIALHHFNPTLMHFEYLF